MTTSIDDQIKGLFQDLEVRKKFVQDMESLVAEKWKTNCSFNLYGNVINIQTCDEKQIVECTLFVLEKSSNLDKVSEILQIEPNLKIQGYSTEQWISDFKKRVSTIRIKKEKEKLQVIEDRLNMLLSPEERRRIEVENLMKELKSS